jgi:hypothetical protein
MQHTVAEVDIAISMLGLESEPTIAVLELLKTVDA